MNILLGLLPLILDVRRTGASPVPLGLGCLRHLLTRKDGSGARARCEVLDHLLIFGRHHLASVLEEFIVLDNVVSHQSRALQAG